MKKNPEVFSVLPARLAQPDTNQQILSIAYIGLDYVKHSLSYASCPLTASRLVT